MEEPAGAAGGASFTPPPGAQGADPDLIQDQLLSRGGIEPSASEAEPETNGASGGEYEGGETEDNEGLEEPLIIGEFVWSLRNMIFCWENILKLRTRFIIILAF